MGSEQDGSFDEYLKNVAMPQVKEILTNYGPISVLWWSIRWRGDDQGAMEGRRVINVHARKRVIDVDDAGRIRVGHANSRALAAP